MRLENHYPQNAAKPLVIYDAAFHAVSFQGAALQPGASTDPVDALPTSGTVAYVVLAPGWSPESSSPPTSLVVLQSRSELEVQLNDALRIVVDDATFAGNCAAGSALTQAQADLITQRVFPADFAGLKYDAATCTTTSAGGSGAL